MASPIAHAAPGEWEARAAWFDDMLAQAQETGLAEMGEPVALGEHAGALLAELEVVFAAGAWLAVIVLAGSVVEAQLREVLVDNALWLSGDVLMQAADLPDAYDGLRRERNRILHVQDPPALSVTGLWIEAEEMEQAARTAVRLVAALLTGDPWNGAKRIDWP